MSAPDHLLYRQVRLDIGLLATRRVGAVPVPACPGWTVTDLVAHLVEVAANVAARLGSPAGTVPRGITDVDLALAEWERVCHVLEPLVELEGPRSAGRMVMDAFTHLLDLHAALDVPPDPGHPAYPSTLNLLIGGFSASVRAHGLPALRIESPAATGTAGDGPVVRTLRAGTHDLHRSLAGRRSHAEIAALDWDGAHEPWLPAFSWGPFTPPAR
ncbi:maleylpyruvate isomerase N-terminal domain-containing protein [Lentzea sp. CC55]|uniref:maleylpyruvate isomerase N-terminal domain-containing protein n=1 Tax=Lentzea sp. CC55 TaxID=2884909 RepID=UPI0027E075F8|nr:maleylpyruvate isomerase N-terminal domain-containing protein [Lentzea sp. CC55]MCG8925454.1 maleylpyruvate isomerase N-terminal domain-containing protein [Lentzea sp. CC55]